MTHHRLCLSDFPRGRRVLLFGRTVSQIDSVEYFDPDGTLMKMDPKAYLLNRDRLILGLDCWPAVRQGHDSQVMIAYQVEEGSA